VVLRRLRRHQLAGGIGDKRQRHVGSVFFGKLRVLA
jgi:hypothetical protein